jgi:hypothetical protein
VSAGHYNKRICDLTGMRIAYTNAQNTQLVNRIFLTAVDKTVTVVHAPWKKEFKIMHRDFV